MRAVPRRAPRAHAMGRPPTDCTGKRTPFFSLYLSLVPAAMAERRDKRNGTRLDRSLETRRIRQNAAGDSTPPPPLPAYGPLDRQLFHETLAEMGLLYFFTVETGKGRKYGSLRRMNDADTNNGLAVLYVLCFFFFQRIFPGRYFVSVFHAASDRTAFLGVGQQPRPFQHFSYDRPQGSQPRSLYRWTARLHGAGRGVDHGQALRGGGMGRGISCVYTCMYSESMGGGTLLYRYGVEGHVSLCRSCTVTGVAMPTGYGLLSITVSFVYMRQYDRRARGHLGV